MNNHAIIGCHSALGGAAGLQHRKRVEPLASAYANATTDARWKGQLAQAFRAVVKRERITKRHSALRRALAKAPDLGG